MKEKVRRVDLEIRDGVLAQFPEDVFPVRHGFSTVKAGNMSLKFGQKEEVEGNRQKILSLLGFTLDEIVIMAPQHKDRLSKAYILDGGEIIQGDGLFTISWGVGLALFPADCFPVIIWGDYSSYDYLSRLGSVGLVHSGRAGTELGIVSKAIKRMGVVPDSMKIAIGPGIGPCCYGGTDLSSKIVEQVVGAGVPEANTVVANCCTCCSKDSHGEYLFFSRVRAKKNKEEEQKEGRFMAFASL